MNFVDVLSVERAVNAGNVKKQSQKLKMTPIPSLTTFQCYLFLIMAAVFCFIQTSRLKPMLGKIYV
jgi:hypothetical protein